MGTYVAFPAGAVRWLTRQPKRYPSSPDVERSFCPTCGGTIGFHRVHETSLAVGSLDAPERLPVDRLEPCHVWCEARVSWFETVDEWPRHARFPSGRAAELQALSGQRIRG